MAVNVLTVSVH